VDGDCKVILAMELTVWELEDMWAELRFRFYLIACLPADRSPVKKNFVTVQILSDRSQGMDQVEVG
jgi:hypothetical protein